MRKILNFLLCISILLVAVTTVSASEKPLKLTPPVCKVIVCQSIDMTTPTMNLTPVAVVTMDVRSTVIQTDSSPVLSIRSGYVQSPHLANIYIDNRINRLLPMPFVRYINAGIQLNHYTNNGNMANTLNNSCRHV
jgi:hypothetical protein